MSFMRFDMIMHCFIREILLVSRQVHYILNASLFFLMVLIFFPLSLPPEPELLRQTAPGLIWIALLLAMLLSSERLFQQDYEDGVIEQWLVSGYSVSLLACIKIWVNWFCTLLPLCLLVPFAGFLFHLNVYEVWVLLGSLVCGSPALFFLCALASVFSGSLRQKGILMALILLPFTIPLMIFGSGAVALAMEGMTIKPQLALLLAISVLAACLLPFAIAAMIRVGMSD